jgi:4-hydroxy-4-methyl-2-oxoglutarate aldolase
MTWLQAGSVRYWTGRQAVSTEGCEMSQWVIRDFDRPPQELVKRLGAVPTGILSDCMNRMQAMDAAVRPISPGLRICGPAFTVQSVESNNWGAHQALALAKAGDVIVLAARGGTQSAVWGHVMTVAAKKRGLAGVVVDGCIRDFAENRADAFPIFARGACPGGPHKGWPCNLNVPVSCAGVAVLPGDVIVGDDDGVVVVPASRAAQVMEESIGRMALEKDWYRRLEAGESTVSLLGLKPL